MWIALIETFKADSDDYREIMDVKDKMSEERKENKPLSFSISMILGEDRKNKQQEEHNPALTASKRVPMATIHHYAPVTDSNYIQFGKDRREIKIFVPNTFNLCVRADNALASLCIRTGSPEHSLVTYLPILLIMS